MKINLERLAGYLAELEPVEAYIVSSEGLILHYNGLSEDAAENLAAWAGYIVEEAGARFGVGDIDSALFYLPHRDIVVHVDGNESIVVIVKRGYGSSVLNAISGRGPRCGRCGEDLSLAVVECPYCGARNPFGTTHCARCGKPILLRRCPKCGALIDSRGTPYTLLDRLLMKKARTAKAIL